MTPKSLLSFELYKHSRHLKFLKIFRVMDDLQSPSPPHVYPQALQLKLYQAFIFSIPILFSIILFLLFYLFYLKRRASILSSPPVSILPRISHQATLYVSSPCQVELKEEIKDKLPIVLFNEELKKRDSQCCVCLGDFEMKEELLQMPSCKHVFHMDCIHHWLHNNTTCPLCRCSIISNIKLGNHPPTPTTMPQTPLEQQQQQESTSRSYSNEMNPNQPQSVVIHVQTHA